MKFLFAFTVAALFMSVPSFAQNQEGLDSYWEKKEQEASALAQASFARDAIHPAQDQDCTAHRSYGGVSAEDALLSGALVEFKEFTDLGERDRLKKGRYESLNGFIEVRAKAIEVKLSAAAIQNLKDHGIDASQIRVTDLYVSHPTSEIISITLRLNDGRVTSSIEFEK